MQYSWVLVGAQSSPSATCPMRAGEDSRHLSTLEDPRSQYSLVGRASRFLPDGAALAQRQLFQKLLTCWCGVSWGRVFPRACKSRTINDRRVKSLLQ